MRAYDWPGNIRELENLMERMVILAEGPILTAADLPPLLLKAVQFKTNRNDLGADKFSVDPDRPFAGGFSSLTGASFKIDNQDHQDHETTEPGKAAESNLNPPADTPGAGPEEPFGPSSSEDLRSLEFWPLIAPLIQFPQEGLELNSLLNQYEDRLIRAALAANDGIKNQTARALGLNRTTFLEKLKKKGLET
jgi:DNA-binding NtrC family response regulator